MGITKNHIHTQDQINLARLFKALGHPARIAIIENLLMHDNLNCNDLRSYIQLAQATISAHIKELHDVGILDVKVVGSNAYYGIYKKTLEQVTDYLNKVFHKIDTKVRDTLCIYFKPGTTIVLGDFISP